MIIVTGYVQVPPSDLKVFTLPTSPKPPARDGILYRADVGKTGMSTRRARVSFRSPFSLILSIFLGLKLAPKTSGPGLSGRSGSTLGPVGMRNQAGHRPGDSAEISIFTHHPRSAAS